MSDPAERGTTTVRDRHSPRPDTEPRDALVVERRQVTSDVVALGLAGAAGSLPRWEPGAHVDLHLGPDLVRQYSLCGPVEDTDTYRVAVRTDPDGRGGSLAASRLRTGDRVSISAPRHHFPLVDAEEYLFLAGGIGITPILPMIERVAAAGRTWTLHYGGRDRASMAFLEELSDRYGTRVTPWPQDERGPVDLSVLGRPRPGRVVYCCGPEPMLAAVAERTTDWDPDDVRTERFAPASESTAAAGFTVRLARSGAELAVPPERSLLDVLAEHGTAVASSCRQGICGTCEVGVLGGRIDHRDDVLDPDEREAGDVMMACVSRARDDVLELDL